MNLRAGYYANGTYNTLITAVREGEFEFYGKASQPALLEITDYERRPLARMLVVNGETYNVEIDPSDKYGITVSGNEVNERWSSFLRKNSKALQADLNGTIAEYIHGHNNDLVSTLLLITLFDASHAAEYADSLMAMIAPEARPSNLTESYNYVLHRLVSETASADVLPLKYIDRDDSLRSFNPAKQPYALLVISPTGIAMRGDSIVPALRRLHKAYSEKNLALLDFSLDSDANEWKRNTLPDSAEWKQAWAAGGVAAMGIERLAIPRTPFFIICDSAGRQLYRSEYLAPAEAKLDSLLSKEKAK